MTKTLYFKHESATAKLALWENGSATLFNLYSKTRGQNHASELMRLICAYLDDHELNAQLRVSRYGYSDRKALTNTQLSEFYRKFGFEFLSSESGKIDDIMYRQFS